MRRCVPSFLRHSVSPGCESWPPHPDRECETNVTTFLGILEGMGIVVDALALLTLTSELAELPGLSRARRAASLPRFLRVLLCQVSAAHSLRRPRTRAPGLSQSLRLHHGGPQVSAHLGASRRAATTMNPSDSSKLFSWNVRAPEFVPASHRLSEGIGAASQRQHGPPHAYPQAASHTRSPANPARRQRPAKRAAPPVEQPSQALLQRSAEFSTESSTGSSESTANTSSKAKPPTRTHASTSIESPNRLPVPAPAVASSGALGGLPIDVFLAVVRFLPLQSLGRLAQTSRWIHSLVEHQIFASSVRFEQLRLTAFPVAPPLSASCRLAMLTRIDDNWTQPIRAEDGTLDLYVLPSPPASSPIQHTRISGPWRTGSRRGQYIPKVRLTDNITACSYGSCIELLGVTKDLGYRHCQGRATVRFEGPDITDFVVCESNAAGGALTLVAADVDGILSHESVAASAFQTQGEAAASPARCSIRAHRGSIRAIAPIDGQRFASVGYDHMLKLWQFDPAGQSTEQPQEQFPERWSPTQSHPRRDHPHQHDHYKYERHQHDHHQHEHYQHGRRKHRGHSGGGNGFLCLHQLSLSGLHADRPLSLDHIPRHDTVALGSSMSRALQRNSTLDLIAVAPHGLLRLGSLRSSHSVYGLTSILDSVLVSVSYDGVVRGYDLRQPMVSRCVVQADDPDNYALCSVASDGYFKIVAGALHHSTTRIFDIRSVRPRGGAARRDMEATLDAVSALGVIASASQSHNNGACLRLGLVKSLYVSRHTSPVYSVATDGSRVISAISTQMIMSTADGFVDGLAGAANTLFRENREARVAA
ncbi:uncharacterized protein BJ171DRAFT_514379 [Polychytrium aggregatum]|uniref:uncharacterized protein n=1 Tax=Polychytrium aggregatum TaxID=110093 RepID=UPI0022FE5671|nr:uncharacterized protein BJ171DRAFT_514379 [Polychytrium aggregatum]KAI9202479.1 hypothetical protein BJ171DRAFT_514379 [Polychytrium aggregatum]